VCDYHAKKGVRSESLKQPTKHDSLSVAISKTRQTSSVINKAFNQRQIVSNLESHSQQTYAMLSVVMMMIMDHSLSTEVPLDLHQSAEKGLDHDGPHRPTTVDTKGR
jgi:hypothetical protein